MPPVDVLTFEFLNFTPVPCLLDFYEDFFSWKSKRRKYDFIYNRIDLCKIEKSILNGSYKLYSFLRKTVPRFLQFKMESLCFFRFETLEEVDEKCYLRIKLEDELVLISLANTLKKKVRIHP